MPMNENLEELIPVVLCHVVHHVEVNQVKKEYLVVIEDFLNQ